MYINYIQRMFRWVDKGSYSNHILLKIEKSIFDKKWNLEGLHELSQQGNQEGWESKAQDGASAVGLGLRFRLRLSLGINMVVNMVPILAVFIILRSKGTGDILFVIKLIKCENQIFKKKFRFHRFWTGNSFRFDINIRSVESD